MVFLLFAQVVVALACFGLGAWWMWRRIHIQGMSSAGTFFDWVEELT